MIGIVNYGMGNLTSVYSALEACGASVEICNEPDELLDKSHIVLPGVGAFENCMSNLKKQGFDKVLHKLVIEEGRPILGICLGMQIMAKNSFEEGECQGLGWINSEVVRIDNVSEKIKVPHVGWNSIEFHEDNKLFYNLKEDSDFYFVHSYQMKCAKEKDVIAVCNYGEKITSAVCNKNIYGVQFHPEKSQDHGLQILKNFSMI